jgi:hypothetical protein
MVLSGKEWILSLRASEWKFVIRMIVDSEWVDFNSTISSILFLFIPTKDMNDVHYVSSA